MSDKKYVEVASTNAREFVKALLALGAQGASLPDESGVFKGVMLRAKLEIDEDVLVEEGPNVKVLPQDKKVAKAAKSEEAKPKRAAKKAVKKEEEEASSQE